MRTTSFVRLLLAAAAVVATSGCVEKASGSPPAPRPEPEPADDGEGRVRDAGFTLGATTGIVRIDGGALFAVVGIVDEEGAPLDDLAVVTLNDDLELQLVPNATWRSTGVPLLPRSDAAVSRSVAGGGVVHCASDVVPCPAVVQTMLSDVFYVGGGTTAVGRGTLPPLQVPRVLAANEGGVTAGGLTCPQAPDDDGTVTCALEARVFAPTLEYIGGSSATLQVPRHGATLGGLDVLFVVGGDAALPTQPPQPTTRTETFVVQNGGIAVVEPGVPDLHNARAYHTMTGSVVAGGYGPGASTYEVLTNNAWRRGALLVPRAEHAAALLPDGRVLLVGGVDPDTGTPLSSTEIIDPVNMTTSRGASLRVARRRPLLGELRGVIVIVGGLDAAGKVVTRAERFDLWRDLSPPVLPVFADEHLTNCDGVALDDSASTVLLNCDAPPAELGVVDDNPATPELVLVDLPTGALRCVSCEDNASIGVAGDALLSRDGQRVVFVDGRQRLSTFNRFLEFADTPANVVPLGSGVGAQLNIDAGYSLTTSAIGFVTATGTAFLNTQSAGSNDLGSRAMPSLGMVSSVRLGGDDSRHIPAALLVRDQARTSVRFSIIDPRPGQTAPTAVDVPGGIDGTAPFISANGEHLAWFTAAALFDDDDDSSIDLMRYDVSAGRTVNLTVDIDGDVCVGDACQQWLSITDDGRVAWLHTTRAGGPRPVLSTLNGRTPAHVVILDEDVAMVSVNDAGTAAIVTRNAAEGRSVAVVRLEREREDEPEPQQCVDVAAQEIVSALDISLDASTAPARVFITQASGTVAELDPATLRPTSQLVQGGAVIAADEGLVVSHGYGNTFAVSLQDNTFDTVVDLDAIGTTTGTEILAAAPVHGFVVVVERTGVVRAIDPATGRQVGNALHVAVVDTGVRPRALVEPLGTRSFVVATTAELVVFDVNLFQVDQFQRLSLSANDVVDLVVVDERFWLLTNDVGGPRVFAGAKTSSMYRPGFSTATTLPPARAIALQAFGKGLMALVIDEVSGQPVLDVLAADGTFQFAFPVGEPGDDMNNMIIEDVTGQTRAWLSRSGAPLRVVDVSGCVP